MKYDFTGKKYITRDMRRKIEKYTEKCLKFPSKTFVMPQGDAIISFA